MHVKLCATCSLRATGIYYHLFCQELEMQSLHIRLPSGAWEIASDDETCRCCLPAPECFSSCTLRAHIHSRLHAMHRLKKMENEQESTQSECISEGNSRVSAFDDASGTCNFLEELFAAALMDMLSSLLIKCTHVVVDSTSNMYGKEQKYLRWI